MKKLPLLGIFIIALFLVVVWFRDGLLLGTGESGLPFYNLRFQHRGISQAWADPALGVATGINVVSAPTYWVLGKLQQAGLPGYLLQALFFGLLFVVSGVSVYFLTKELFPKVQSRYLLLASFFYWFNPVSLIVWNRFLYNYMVFWAFLPLALLLFLKGIRKKDYRLAVVASLSTAVFSYALTSIPFNIILWFLFFYTAIFFVLTRKITFSFGIRYFFLTATLFVIFNFWWISQFLTFVFSSTKVVVESFFSSGGNLGTLSALSTRLGNITDTIRLMHGTFFNQNELSWSKIYTLFPLTALEYFFAGLILWVIVKFRKKFSVLYLGGLFIISIFLTKGNNPPLGEIFEWFFTKFTVLQVFRNPFEKFGFLLPLSVAPLFAFGVSEFSKRLKSVKWKRGFISFSFLYVLVFLGFPFWTGFVFTSEAGRRQVESYQVKVPDYYRQANEWFKKQGDNFRFISLPLGGEGMTYTWEKPYSGVELSSILFEVPNISFNTTIPFYNKIVSEISKYQLTEKFLRFMPFINGKYIVWRGDIDFKLRHMANPKTAKSKLEDLVKKGIISKQYETGELAVYKVDDKWFWPKFYMTPNLLLSNQEDLGKITDLFPKFPAEKVAILDYRRLSKERQLQGRLVISPDKIFLPQISLATKNFSDQDLMARLFYVKHLPDKWFYPLVRIKERLLTPSKSDYFAWILYRTEILGKRAVEVYKLKALNKSGKLISKAEESYLKELDNLAPFLSEAVASEVIRESLLYQFLLLIKTETKVSQALSDLLLDWNVKPQFELPDVEEGKYTVYHFEVPKDGKYKLVIDKSVVTARWLLDGKPQVVITNAKESNENLISLSKGSHELAFLDQDSRTEELVLEKEELTFDDNTKQTWTIDLPDEPSTYKIEFDFRFKKGGTFQIQFNQDIDQEESSVFSTRVIKDNLYHDWRHWEAEFKPSVGANLGVLLMSPAKQEICKRSLLIKKVCREEVARFSVEIRNFRIKRVVQPDVFLVTESNFPDQTESSVSFTKIYPTLYEVQINKTTDYPEILVFSELFDNGWKAVFDDGTVIPEDKHLLVNVYANGWVIDKPGNYNLTIKFAPQDLLEKGEKISLASIFSAIVFLGVLSWRKRRQ